MPATFQKTDPRLTLTSGTTFLALLPNKPPRDGRVETNGVWDVYINGARRLDVDEEWPVDWKWAEPSTIPWKTEDPRKWVYKTAHFLVRRGLEYVYAEIETKHANICNVGGQRLREGEPWPSDWAWVQLLS